MEDRDIVNDADDSPVRERPMGQLISDASEQGSRLVRDEMRLAVPELQRKGKRAALGGGSFGTAGVLAFYGGAALVACLIMALSLVLAPWLVALIVAFGLLMIAGGSR